ncbi:MAG: malonyl-ACP O-methyltransferase BioC [Desulfobulbaceae bacterium]|nr:malonyl-ACP O-methyltransferase BioC [Desulfobulbaceae bacterium]
MRAVHHLPTPAMIADKSLISRRFANALATYEDKARVQAQVADTLLAYLFEAVPGINPQSAFEIGCCTGMLTEKLVGCLPSLERLTVCDLVAAFQSCIDARSQAWQQYVTFLAGDIEKVELPHNYDLILSSSTLHWVHDFPALSAKLAKHLNPGGTLAIGLYGPDNFTEILEITGSGLPYHSLEELQHILSQHFRLHLARESREELWFADPLAILHHLRDTGVNALSPAGWTKGRLAKFAASYQERFSGEQGVRLTYHPLYFIATKA